MSSILFLKLALEKLLKDSKRNSPLRESCRNALDKISEQEEAHAKAKVGKGKEGGELGIDLHNWNLTPQEYFAPFKIACETQNMKVMETALDWLQKLIAYGTLIDETKEDGSSLMNDVMVTICGCFGPSQGYDRVQLQIIKAILPAVTATPSQVHGQTLLSALRTVYNVYVVSRDVVNQQTSKVTLQQMVEAVFRRMEVACAERAWDSEAPSETRSVDSASKHTVPSDPATRTPATEGDVSPGVAEVGEVGHEVGPEVEGVGPELPPDVEGEDDVTAEVPAETKVEPAVEHETVPQGKGEGEVQAEVEAAEVEGTGEVPRARDEGEGEGEVQGEDAHGTAGEGEGEGEGSEVEGVREGAEVQSEVEGEAEVHQDVEGEDDMVPPPSAPPAGDGDAPKAASSEAVQYAPPQPGKYGFCVVCGKPANRYSMKTKRPLCGVECRNRHLASLTQDENVADDLINDAFLLFKALCKLSCKDLAPNLPGEHTDMKSKLLSMELLLSILNNAGPAFRNSPRFVSAVKQYLCGGSLLKNGVSPVPSVFALSLSMFQTLMARFKDNLKVEIGIFFSNIFLMILESTNTTTQQKYMVLEVLSLMCQQPQVIVDIFLNYDCDIKGMNLFQRIVNDLSKIAQQGSSQHHPTGTSGSEAPLELLSLKCLVAILTSMVQWSKDQGEEHEEQAPGDDGNSSVVIEAPPLSPKKEDEGLDSPGIFEKRKQIKHHIQQGINAFNMKPKKGIAFLLAGGQLENTPESICNFLMNEEALDKGKLGEYLGEPDDMNQAVMHCWVFSYDFSGGEFVPSLRTFLAGFRLPGEAQKIDRIMLKYAERYFINNPGSFNHADAAYVLAFATIMLNTDLHNPMVKRKMTKPDFLKMNRGINDGESLPEEFLSAIFDDIAENEIRLRDDNGKAEEGDKSKRHAYAKETEAMVQKSKSLFKKTSMAGGDSKYYVATHMEHAKLMFRTSWHPVLVVFSVLLESSENANIISLCLEGIKRSIHIASIFHLETERDTFISSLAKFTYLDNLREMKHKNIQSILALIAIAQTDGNFLGESWHLVLSSISQLERLQIIGAGGGREVDEINSTPPKSDPKGSRRSKGKDKDIEAANSLSVVANVDAHAIDRIFTGSTELNNTAIVDFVKQLCKLAREETACESPRTFLLLKIVDVADFNMERIRFVWSKMWIYMAEVIEEVGCHSNSNLADIVLDSLKQLSLKFLAKDELTNFTFQKHFLKPFEHIMANNEDPGVRDMVIACLNQIIVMRADSIKSGWECIFVIFSQAASCSPPTIKLGFDIVERVLQEYFAQVTDVFIECARCLVKYGQQLEFGDISLRAIEFLHFCARELASGRVPRANPLEGDEKFTDSEEHVRYWWPLLEGLSELVGHEALAVRTKALQVLFDILKTVGPSFSVSFWTKLFKDIIMPVFDPARAGGADVSADRAATYNNAMRALVDLITCLLPSIRFLFVDVRSLLISAVLQDSESLARIGMAALDQLLTDNGSQLTEEEWAGTWTALARLQQDTSPVSLLSFKATPLEEGEETGELEAAPRDDGDDNVDAPLGQATSARGHVNLDFRRIIVKCVVQLLLLQVLNDVIFTHFNHLTSKHLKIILDTLQCSYKFAFEFNTDTDLRVSLWRAGFMKQLPNLLKQETSAVSCSIRVLMRAYEQLDVANMDEEGERLEGALVSHMQSIGTTYLALPAPKHREIAAWTPIIILVLNGLLSFADEVFKRHMGVLYPIITDLVRSERSEVREALAAVLTRVGILFSVHQPSQAET